MPPDAIARSVCDVISRLAAPQQELERRGRRELRRRAEPAVGGVVAGPQALHGGVESGLLQRLGGRLEQRAAAQPLRDAGAARADLLALLLPCVRHRLEHLAPARHAHARLGREVGARVERHLLGRQERVQRPAPRARHRLACLHVDRVEVGPLLAIELDADEQLVHQARGLGVLERLALHHVAPVAGRVPDREEDRLVLLARAREGDVAPRVPVDRVVLVLEEVRGGLACELVGHPP